MKKIYLMLVLVAAVSAATVAGTMAIFTSQETLANSAQVVAATIDVGTVGNAPLKFEGVVPGTVQSQEVTVENGSNVAADMWIYLSPGTAGDKNFAPVAMVAVWDLNTSVRLYEGLMGNLFKSSGSWESAAPLKIADNMAAGQVKSYRVDFWLDRNAGNEYMGRFAYSNLNIVAAQADASEAEIKTAY